MPMTWRRKNRVSIIGRRFDQTGSGLQGLYGARKGKILAKSNFSKIYTPYSCIDVGDMLYQN
jgi:hypothetical protein